MLRSAAIRNVHDVVLALGLGANGVCPYVLLEVVCVDDYAQDVGNICSALAKGIERARQLKQGQAPWLGAGGVRAYVSKIDGSVQPYGLVVPPSYRQTSNTAEPISPFRSKSTGLNAPS